MNKNTLEDEKIISHQWDFPFTELILNELENSRQEGKSVWLSGNESKFVSKKKKMLEMTSVSRKKTGFQFMRWLQKQQEFLSKEVKSQILCLIVHRLFFMIHIFSKMGKSLDMKQEMEQYFNKYNLTEPV